MLTAILPHSPRGKVLAAGALLDALATGLYLAVATLYFVEHVGIPATSVGVALSVANVCALLVPMPVARLTGRLGTVRVYVSLLVMRGMAMAAFALVDSVWRYLVVTCAFTMASRAALPLLQVLVGRLEGGTDRTRTMASLRTVNNIGLALGFLLTAGVQLLHSGLAYLVLFIVGGLIFTAVAVVTVVACSGLAGGERPAAREHRPRSVYRDGRFLTVAVANAVLLLHDSLLFILLPLWVVQRCGLPPTVSSLLLMLNTVMTVVLQVRVSRYAKGFTGALRLLRWSVVALGAAAVALGSAGRAADLWVPALLCALAVALLTVGENLHAVAGWELSFLMSDPVRRPQYLSLFSLGYTAQLAVGPVLVTSLVLPWGLPALLAVALLFVLAAAVTVAAVRGRVPAPEPEELIGT